LDSPTLIFLGRTPKNFAAATLTPEPFNNNTMSITAKTKKTQKQILLAYLKRVKRGITSLEAAIYLHMVCVHKRVAELIKAGWPIIKVPELTANGKTITRYKLAR